MFTFPIRHDIKSVNDVGDSTWLGSQVRLGIYIHQLKVATFALGLYICAGLQVVSFRPRMWVDFKNTSSQLHSVK